MGIYYNRLLHKGEYDTDFSFLNNGHEFPTKEVSGRNVVYRYRHKQYTGEYAINKKLKLTKQEGSMEVPYKVLSLNYFELLTNKMNDLVLNNDIIIKTGDTVYDAEVNKLVEKTNFIDALRQAFVMVTEYGDACIKTYKTGVSAFKPLNAFKIVDKHNINNVKGIVLYEVLKDKEKRYIRFEVNIKGFIFEIVKEFYGTIRTGGTVGKSVEYRYNGRIIPAGGEWYSTGVPDRTLVQWCSISKNDDGVYGKSLYKSIEDIVYTLEQRISSEGHLLDNSMMPFIILSQNMVETDERTGNVSVKLINGNMLVSAGGEGETKAVELNYNLSNNESFIDILKQELYELSEMGKTFLSGEYSGNISEESLNNIIKSAIDKANRLLCDVYSSFVDSLYCLCKLNNIDIKREDIVITFNIGRTDDAAKIADIAATYINNNIFSKATTRERLFGYTQEQSDNEDEQIKKEQEQETNVNQQ